MTAAENPPAMSGGFSIASRFTEKEQRQRGNDSLIAPLHQSIL
jgi:hypothetical protein